LKIQIIYEITLQGAIVSVSKKLALGHEAHEMIGKISLPLFIQNKQNGLIF
jgi:hypothetical protein